MTLCTTTIPIESQLCINLQSQCLAALSLFHLSFCSAVVAMGLYGNQETRKGVHEFVAATEDFTGIVVSVQREVRIHTRII